VYVSVCVLLLMKVKEEVERGDCLLWDVCACVCCWGGGRGEEQEGRGREMEAGRMKNREHSQGAVFHGVCVCVCV
jgi:hypothetical protein